MDKVVADRFMRFLLVIRQACLLIAGWVESETNTRGKATGELRTTTDPEQAPLQFRRLTDDELESIAERVHKKVLHAMKPVDSINVQ